MSVRELTLDQIGQVARGRSRHRPRDAAFLYGGPFPFIQTGDVKRANLYLAEYEQTYSDAGLAQSRLWTAGTLCITIAANIAETAILGIDACFPDSVIGFTADPTKADARFVKYLFDGVLKSKYRSFTQGAAQDNLSQEKLLSIKFPVPELPAQRRVADILSAYDDLIENNRRRIALLEEAARVLYRVGEHNTPKVSFPTLVTGRSGSLGKVCFVDDPCWPLNTSLWVTEFKAVSVYFAYFMLNELNLSKFNGGASVPTLDRKVAHAADVVVPLELIRSLFDGQVRDMFAQRKLLDLQIQKLGEARDLLLPRLMNGEITV